MQAIGGACELERGQREGGVHSHRFFIVAQRERVTPTSEGGLAARKARSARSDSVVRSESVTSSPVPTSRILAASLSTRAVILSAGPSTLASPLVRCEPTSMTAAEMTTRLGVPTMFPMTTRSAPRPAAKRTTSLRGTSADCPDWRPARRPAPRQHPPSASHCRPPSRVESSSTMPSRRYASEPLAPATRKGATTTLCSRGASVEAGGVVAGLGRSKITSVMARPPAGRSHQARARTQRFRCWCTAVVVRGSPGTGSAAGSSVPGLVSIATGETDGLALTATTGAVGPAVQSIGSRRRAASDVTTGSGSSPSSSRRRVSCSRAC